MNAMQAGAAIGEKNADHAATAPYDPRWTPIDLAGFERDQHIELLRRQFDAGTLKFGAIYRDVAHGGVESSPVVSEFQRRSETAGQPREIAHGRDIHPPLLNAARLIRRGPQSLRMDDIDAI